MTTSKKQIITWIAYKLYLQNEPLEGRVAAEVTGLEWKLISHNYNVELPEIPKENLKGKRKKKFTSHTAYIITM